MPQISYSVSGDQSHQSMNLHKVHLLCCPKLHNLNFGIFLTLGNYIASVDLEYNAQVTLTTFISGD